MIRRLPAIVLYLSAFVVVAPFLLAQQITAPTMVSNTERMNFTADGTIRLDDSYGNLSIQGWDQADVKITVIKSTPYGYKPKKEEETRARLDAIRVTTKRISDNELVITTTLPGRRSFFASPLSRKTTGGVMLEYQIFAPRKSKLVIHHGAGSIFLSDVSGDIDATGSSGDITLMLSDRGPYSIDARTKLGKISSDFEGTSHKHHFVGRTFTSENTATRRIQLRMGYGGITIMAPTLSFVR